MRTQGIMEVRPPKEFEKRKTSSIVMSAKEQQSRDHVLLTTEGQDLALSSSAHRNWKFAEHLSAPSYRN